MKEALPAYSKVTIQVLLDSPKVTWLDKTAIARTTSRFLRDKMSPENIATQRKALENLRVRGAKRSPIDECWAALLDFDGDIF